MIAGRTGEAGAKVFDEIAAIVVVPELSQGPLSTSYRFVALGHLLDLPTSPRPDLA